MKQLLCGSRANAAVLLAGLLVPALAGQDIGSATSTSTTRPELVTVKQKGKFLGPVSVGFRVRGFPLDLLQTRNATLAQTSPTKAWTYTSTSNMAHVSFGGSIEISLTRRLLLAGELFRTRVGYTTGRDVYVGDIAADGTDNRLHTIWSETTKATWWDLPVMLRWEGLRGKGWLSRSYMGAGGVVRTTRSISTANTITYPDSTTSSDTIATNPGKNRIMGGVVGIGFRFIDDFNIKVTPEARYTRWTNTLFNNSESRHSRRDQVEVGIGLSF